MADVMLEQFIVFSDHHAHTFSFGAKEEEHSPGMFVNSRLRAAVAVLDEISHYAQENNVKNVVFCGDMFHVRESVPTIATNLVYDSLKAMAKSRNVWLMPGNHDYADRFGNVHSLHTFESISNVKVVDWTSKTRTFSNSGKMGEPVMFSFVPYSDDRDRITEALIKASNETMEYVPHILFGHFGIQGAKVGSDYVLVHEADLSVSDIPWTKFTGCFFGHYHEHQQLFKNGWYVGATHQHNWGDANSYRGFLHVKVFRDYVEFEKIETHSAPKFFVTKDEAVTNAGPEDFVRLLTSRKLSPKEVEELRDNNTSKNCEIVYIPEESSVDIELSEENLSPNAMVAAWVKAHKKTLPTDEKQLITYGQSLLVNNNG